ncbi:serine--tRNA ligase [Patescibacteria group bacterium]|nr:serine--tRNA ligase [Patescibacteria group bacterium]
MLDINYIKENSEFVKKVVKYKGVKDVDVEGLLGIYEQYLNVLKEVENLRNSRNEISSSVSRVGGKQREELISKATKIKNELSEKEEVLNDLKIKIDATLPSIPNVISDEMPIGKDESDNLVLKVWDPEKGYLKTDIPLKYDDISYAPEQKFDYKDHIEIGEKLDLIDVEQSGKVSGSRFCYLKNEAVIIQDAISAILKKELLRRGFIPFIPPLLVKERSLFGTSHFPEGRSQVYEIKNENVEEGNSLFLVGSSEPSNFSYFMDKVLKEEELPIKVYAQTTCFRSEVGSWGKDVRGIKRVHQFDKLEMNCVCKENQEREVFDEFIEINEWLFQQLEIPYRVINKCTGDCGYNASYFQYDIESWRPGDKEYMEAGTDTMTTDYQARRLNIKYRNKEGLKFARTVNDTGVAFGRAIIAILENHQQEDGSINIPKALHLYTGFKKILPKA